MYKYYHPKNNPTTFETILLASPLASTFSFFCPMSSTPLFSIITSIPELVNSATNAVQKLARQSRGLSLHRKYTLKVVRYIFW